MYAVPRDTLTGKIRRAVHRRRKSGSEEKPGLSHSKWPGPRVVRGPRAQNAP
jgi:hypothetical protein